MGLFGSVGKIFNDITGVTNSAKINNQYQKEFAQNAHQWEVKDLQSAGLNPILSAGGSGATASGGGSAGTGSMGLTDVMNSAAGIAQTLSNIDLQKSNEEVNESQTELNKVEAANRAKHGGWINNKAEADIAEAYSRMAVNSAKKQETKENIKKIKGGKITEYTGTEEAPEKDVKNIKRSFNAAKKINEYMTPLGWINQIRNYKK